jgi:ParB/RepB/Spo0J family partition protein
MAEVKTRDLKMVPYENLKIITDFNIRTDYGDIPLLCSQILEHGVKVPLQGYKEKGSEIYVIKDGHRRYKALTYLKENGQLPESIFIPFVLEPQKYNDERRVIDMFIMNEGKPLTPLEQAEGIKRLQQWGHSDKEIASKIGRSIAYIGKLALLISAPKKLTNMIESGKVSASFAMDIISKGETDKFLADVDAGKFDSQSTSNGHEIFPDATPKKAKAKITKGDIDQVNSWKLFKKWAVNVDDKLMETDKAKVFKMLCRMMNNELTEDHFKRFFK